MSSNAEISSDTQDVLDCLLEDSESEVHHEQMDNVEIPRIDNDVSQYCEGAHQSDRARLEKFVFVLFFKVHVVLPLLVLISYIIFRLTFHL